MYPIKWNETHQWDWIPKLLISIQLDQLYFILSFIGLNKKFMKYFSEWQPKVKTLEFMDLGSGSGNLIKALFENSDGKFNNLKYTLSDVLPQIKTYESLKKRFAKNIDYYPKSLEITQADKILDNKGVTMSTVLHELSPAQLGRTFQNLFSHSEGFLILEPLNRNIFQFIKLPLLLLASWLAPFFTFPYRWYNFVFSTLIPIVPLMHLHDGLISFLKTYSKKDLVNILKNAGNNGFIYEVENIGVDFTLIRAWKK